MTKQIWDYVWYRIRCYIAKLQRREAVFLPPALLHQEWDVAAETGEFTHILKDGPTTISVTPARTPT